MLVFIVHSFLYPITVQLHVVSFPDHSLNLQNGPRNEFKQLHICSNLNIEVMVLGDIS